MPHYLLIDDATGTVEEVFDRMSGPIAEARFGDLIEVEGRTLRKALPSPMIDVEKDWAHVAYQIDPDDPDLPPHRDPRTGCAVFLNKREILDFEAKQDARPPTHQRMRYDFGRHR